MKIKQTILGMAILIGMGSLFVIPSGLALAATCDGVETAIISCEVDSSSKNIQSTGLWGILLLVINILTAGVGVLAVGGIVYGSILYASSGGSSDQAKKGIEVITNVVIGLVAYALMFSFLNFIIPGGLFA